MKEQFISYETALLAKEKGFDYTSVELFYSSETKVKSVSYNEIQAPTQSLLQKWLREKHGIYADYYKKKGTGWDMQIRKESEDVDMMLYQFTSRDKFPEEDFEKVLQQALKLI